MQPGAAFEVGPIGHVVFGRCLGDIERSVELRVRGQRLERRVEILLDIGPEMEPSADFKDTLDVAYKRFSHDAANPVSPLPPGVGEIDMHGRHGILRQQLAEEPQCVGRDNLDVGKLPTRQTGSRISGKLGRNLHAEEVDFRAFGGGGPQEEALARAYLDLKRRGTSKQCLGIPWQRQIVRRLQMSRQIDRRIGFFQSTTTHRNNWEKRRSGRSGTYSLVS